MSMSGLAFQLREASYLQSNSRPCCRSELLYLINSGYWPNNRFPPLPKMYSCLGYRENSTKVMGSEQQKIKNLGVAFDTRFDVIPWFPVADPAFPRGGRLPNIWHNFCQKLHENEKNWTGARPSSPS